MKKRFLILILCLSGNYIFSAAIEEKKYSKVIFYFSSCKDVQSIDALNKFKGMIDKEQVEGISYLAEDHAHTSNLTYQFSNPITDGEKTYWIDRIIALAKKYKNFDNLSHYGFI